jgi:dTDP-4-amino-4,6-dideoxygalactose transaminase
VSKLALHGGPPVRTKTFKPWPPRDPATEQRLREIYRSGIWGQGKEIRAFEQSFAAFIGAGYGVAVSSGTTALEIAIQSLGIAPGTEVIVPAYTFFSTVSAVLKNRAIPVFADVDPDTFCIDINDIKTKMTDKTQVIIPVHIFGYPMDLQELLRLADRGGIKVIEDCAHAHGAARQGRKAGDSGNMSAFSFMNTKLMSSGEGGIVLTPSEDYAARAASLRDCGRLPGKSPYEHFFAGSNHRMTEFQAVILNQQIEQYPASLELRRRFAKKLIEQLGQIDGLQVRQREDESVHHAYLAVAIELSHDDMLNVPTGLICLALQKEGIPCEPGYDRPVYRNSVLLNEFALDLAAVRCPVAEDLCRKVILIPHQILSGGDQDIQDIIDAIIKVKENAMDLLFDSGQIGSTPNGNHASFRSG